MRLIILLYYLLTGRGGDRLIRKREFHRRRAKIEKQILAEAQHDRTLLCENVCPTCGNQQTSAADGFSNRMGFAFHVCSEDGTVYMNPVPTVKALGRLYNDPAMKLRVERGDSNEHRDYAALRQMIGAVERISLLDVGCSTGEFLQVASETFEAEGVEISDALADAAREKGLRAITGRVEDLAGSNVYDVITMLQVLEHIAEPRKTLYHIHRLLKPEGYLYINVPNIDSASFKYLGHRHVHVGGFGHVSLFNKSSLIKCVESCGFEFVKHEYWGGRDLALHDAVSLWLAPDRFAHRNALYSPRLYHLSAVVDALTFGVIGRLIFPGGNETYQRALFRKKLASNGSL